MVSPAQLVDSVLGHNAHKHYFVPFLSRPYDPVVKYLKEFGFEVYNYRPKPAPWHTFLQEMVVQTMFLTFLATWLTVFARMNKSPIRSLGGIMGLVYLAAWPMLYGQTGIRLLDYGLPAFGFLGFLHIVDVFFLRPIEEVQSWSVGRTVCQLMAFPKEKSVSPNPRWENFKVFGLCFLKYAWANALLYASPPPHVWASLKPFSFQWFAYSWVTSQVILCTLGFFVEAVIRLIGFIFGVEQGYMFDSPMWSSNIREFWSRWNMVIKDGLSRVFFHFKPPKIRSSSSKNGKANGNSSAVANGAAARQRLLQQRLRKTDHFSETELSADDASSSPESKEKKLVERKIEKDPKKKKPAFLPKAFSATLTFFASGMFHEWMNAMAFPEEKHGETVGFFLFHAAGTIVYSLIKRNFPGALSWIPKPLAIVFVNIFLFLSTPLFVGPFLRVGFFEDLKAFGIFGPVNSFVWLFGHSNGKHYPRFLKK